MDFFSKYVDRTVRQHRNSIRRLAYLRDLRVKLKLQHVIKEDQLIKMIMESQDVLAGNIYKSINVLERNQNRKIEEIKDALLSRENQNTLINITEI